MTRRRPAKIITRVIVFLLLGAIVNVAVAWGWLLLQPSLGVDDTGFPIPQVAVNLAHDHQIDLGKRGEYYRMLGLFAYTSDSGLIYARAGLPLTSVEEAWLWFAADAMAIPSGHSYLSYTNRAFPSPVQSRSGFFSCLPIRPLWPGFAINTIFYAAILWLLFFAPGSVRRVFRRRRGLCPACAYPIGTSPVCTECGKPVIPKSVEPT